ncbi:unnamed protein product [Phaedon cochleariae]|uniref:Ku70/Ku80 N-terminal alpha/beta domain-containing protein n=1 Tax=Phaedon cochleariae TaxID=80249 RepID=A0A9P0GNK2_PHACE|nr:unnamed protein product [Phaedon cochleariae]
MFRNEEDEASDYDEGDETFESHNFKPSYVVVAIDTHHSMFKRNKENKLHFRSCLEACLALADSLILKTNTRSWRPFSIVLSGQQTALIGFHNNILDTIKLLKAKLQLSDDALTKEFQSKGELDLAAFFLVCKKLFHDIKTTFYKRSLIYITNNDNPVNKKAAKFTALNEAKTFSGSEIEFQVIPTENNFNYKIFYNELLSLLGGPRIEEICLDTEGLTLKLSSSVGITQNQRRMKFYPFLNDQSRYLKCVKLDVVSQVGRLINVMMTKDGKKVMNMTEVSEESPEFFIKSHAEGVDHVRFDLAEKNMLQHSSIPIGITMMYVSKRLVDIGHVFTKPYLLKEDPSEELPFFNKFWQGCVDMDRVLICIVNSRELGKIRYSELIPVLVDDSPMFLVKSLPYANEISYPVESEYPEYIPDEEKRKVVEGLVDKLTFDFNISMVPDAVMEKKKAYIKAKLLDEPTENVDGPVTCDKDTLDEHLKDVVRDIKNKFVLSGEKKRKAPAPRGPSKKKQK